MSKCESCKNHVHQAGLSKSLSNLLGGKIFRNTALERDGRVSVAHSGCLHSGEIWERKPGHMRKPRGMSCKYVALDQMAFYPKQEKKSV